MKPRVRQPPRRHDRRLGHVEGEVPDEDREVAAARVVVDLRGEALHLHDQPRGRRAPRK